MHCFAAFAFAPGLACIYCYFFPFVVMTNIKNNRIKLATKCNSSVLYYLFSEKVFSYNLLQSIDVYTVFFCVGSSVTVKT